MYQNEGIAQSGVVAQKISSGMDRVQQSPTLSENIDRRIASMKAQITQLESVKVKLAEPGGILNVPMDDLRMAMNY